MAVSVELHASTGLYGSSEKPFITLFIMKVFGDIFIETNLLNTITLNG